MNGINRTRYIALLSLFCCSLLLASCDGSSSDTDTNTAKTAPGAFNLTNIAPSTTKAKTLVFSWDASSHAKSYTLCQARYTNTATDRANCTVLKDALTTTTVTTTGIIDHGMIRNPFFVIAKNDNGNKSSNEKSLTLNDYITMIAYLKASNIGVIDFFGTSVALSSDGNTLAVGAYAEDSSTADDPTDDNASYSGAVYVFTRSATGVWTQQQYLKASNISADDRFGSSVALSGDGNTLAVGAPYESSSSVDDPTDDSNLNSGAVYVFSRSSGTWGTPQYLKASKADRGAKFGRSVTLSSDGNTLAVGAYLAVGPSREASSSSTILSDDDSGAVYIFTRSATATWAQQQYLKTNKPRNIGAGDNFGYSVTLSGDGNTLAVGATGDDSSSADTPTDDFDSSDNVFFSGAVYVFTRSGTGTWTQQQYLKASNIGEDDYFGTSVALSSDGNTLAVGAWREDSGNVDDPTDDSKSNSGAVYVFSRSGSTWGNPQYLKASNIGKDDQFGYSVALSGDGNTLAVGAWREDSSNVDTPTDDGSADDSGAVYLFSRSAGTWTTTPKYLKADNIGKDDNFGYSVALSTDGNTLAVGAIGEASSSSTTPEDDATPLSGAVYIY